ncbi:MAG TPA: serine/threonine-protein kinase [Polyangiaceae bacterium]|nr:serine/threonine-protein kinase [Polyangiaceae bacterium]
MVGRERTLEQHGGADTQESASDECDDSLLRRFAGCYGGDAPEDAPVAVPPLGSIIGEKYQLERLLGRGGMGCVFAARHVATGRPVAIKWMLRSGDVEQHRKRFLREARAAGRICHANVIDIYDVVSSAAGTYLVMELLEGESLRARLNRGRLDPEHAVRIASCVLEGLREAHQRGVIHRDLKPENVFLCSAPGDAVKILDFGISVLCDAQPLADANLTRTGYFVGTPVYTALERLREKQPFDHRVDLYSVGVMLYEALTGVLPFKGKSPFELTYQLATGTPQPLRCLRPELPRALEAVVLQAMARAPEQRYADAHVFGEALRAALLAPEVPDQGTPGPRTRRDDLKRPAARAALASLAAGAVASIFYWGAAAATPAAAASHLKPRLHVHATRSAALLASEKAAELARRATPPLLAALESQSLAARAGAGPQQRTASSSLRERTARSSSASATLTVIAFPYGDVWVNGRSVGSSPATVGLPPGRHVVSGGRTAQERQSTIELAPGDNRRVVLSWANSGRAPRLETAGRSAPANLQAKRGDPQLDTGGIRVDPTSD